MYKVLIIEDDFQDQNILRTILPEAYSLTMCSSGLRAVELLRSSPFEAILLDLVLPDLDGFSILQEIQALPQPPPVIIITGQSDSETASRAFRSGVYDYMEKPFSAAGLLSALSHAVERHIRKWHASAPNTGRTGDNPVFAGFIGESDSMQTVKHLISCYAPSELPLLITGESGTGKELAARAVHNLSPFRNGPFIPVNCGAVPESLIEAEFFGSEKGAYTDAVTRPGIFELADGGTILLDEIGEMGIAMQVKLLRVLEQNVLLRVGGATPRPFRVRVVAATNSDIEQAVKTGKFRQDLYYRIAVLQISLPPLRNRKSDIPLLAGYLLSTAHRKTGAAMPCPILTRPAEWKLCEHGWPGNIRELKNVLERALLLCREEEIGPEMIVFR